jgi:N-dimethylarginine dimethylaminohydrolase
LGERSSIELERARTGQRLVLMGDPAHFSVKSGANPHTRTRWGTKRRVDRALAIEQWHGLRRTLEELGVRVLVVPPDPAQPGLVYPANAGFTPRVDQPLPAGERDFFLANLLPTRAGEKEHYRKVVAEAGLRVHDVDARYRFEGEADFFPAGEHYLLTHGRLERQRFVPAWQWPPWRRVYGFRTDLRVQPLLEEIVGSRDVIRIELTLEAHYHGDTVLAAFGPQREFLLGYRAGIAEAGWAQLEGAFRDRLIPLCDSDAARYAANAFTLTSEQGSFLILPAGVSERLQDQVRDRGVTPLTVDVSEFLKKGGGSVKCMIGDLGVVVGKGDLEGDRGMG